MGTILQRLQSTLSLADQTWQSEQNCQSKHATNESAWSVQVIEPLLAALDWPRLRRGDRGTGAYYEWPRKNAIDVALLSAGQPLAFWELKKHRRDCSAAYMRARLDIDPALSRASFAVAAWHERPGFCLYRIGEGSALVIVAELRLEDAVRDPMPLARLAAPVLMKQVPDTATWLNFRVWDAGPRCSRFRPRDVQRRFFQLLCDRLGLIEPPTPRHRCTVFHPPTPTYAFTELPGIFPAGWGLVFGIDPTLNDLQCSFFRCGNVELENVGRWTFDGRTLNDTVLSSFLDQRVLPHIERWRRAAASRSETTLTATRLPSSPESGH